MPKVTLQERIAALKLAVKWTYNSSKPLTVVVFLITVLAGLLTVVEPYVFRIIIDRIVSGAEFSFVEKMGIGIAGILVIYAVAKILQNLFWDMQMIIKRIHAQRLDKYATRAMMEKVSSLDAVYFENPEYYNTLTKANQHLWRVTEFFWQFTWFAGQAVSVVVILSALFAFNWLVVALILLASLPSIVLAFRASEILWSAFDTSSPIFRHAYYYKSLMTERPEAVKEIKLFGLKSHFLERFDSLFSDFLKKQEKAAWRELALFSGINLLGGALSVFAAWFVIKEFVDGGITIGQVTFYWALLFQFAENARHMVRMIGELNQSAIFLSPVVKILSFEPVIKEAEHPHKFPSRLKKGIEFRNVTFYYPRSKKPALKNFNLLIKPGQSLALVGENGSGKTTLVKLLTRLYDVSEGEIFIDGKNIKEYSLDSLYENIGVIFQDFMKYEALVEENIGYGRLGKIKRKGRVHEASVKAEAWEFIKELEQKYKTHIGKTLVDEGTELSIGQWQKIALARAFFKDANLLCLDEPTAAVDARAEYRLFRKFRQLTKNKTTILISHRFSTVRMADRIIVMHNGKIVEQGSHRQLLANKGRYSRLFRMQASGYKDFFDLQKGKAP
ncbi:MAG: ABC transporter ATP-binding protein/permease [Nanoarchaeota archaeon]|nr:ABC transporter ATP-binding protein/permease [Nanoarchaeota archaeon]